MDDMNVRILALCAGYGGLEMAVTAGIGGSVVAFAENDPHAAAVFSSHHPGVPNLGDITEADWTAVRDQFSPTVIAAGFPCRNISNAGDRTGIDGEFSRVWKNVAEAVGVVRPRYVFLENVAAILRRGIDTVAGDLAGIGYDARWTCLRASESEIGSCHPRNRWFCLAYPTDADPDHIGRHWRPRNVPESQGWDEPAHRGHAPAGAPGGVSLLPTPVASDGGRGSATYSRGNPTLTGAVRSLLPTPKASDGPHGGPNQRDTTGNFYLPALAIQPDRQWIASTGKDYGPAIRRWERVTGRPAPCPTEPGARGNRRLSPAFTEWMMGLPDGWVTAVPDIPRNEQLKILGNGVVWQQAYEGYSRLFAIDTSGMDDMSTETEQKTDKPRGACAGCGFEYTLSLARSGEHKGESVTRKHNSRVGPGLCEGAQKPPREEDLGEESSPVAELRAAGAFDLPHDIAGGDLIQSDDGTVTQDLTRVEHTYDDGNGGVWAHPGSSESCTLPECAEIEQQRVNAAAAGINSVMAIADPSQMTNAAFVDPAPMPAELPPVSGQPEPDRDRWSRYLLPGPDGRKQPHTRATSFAKLGSSTFALSEWGERMLIKGLTERPDLLALAHGLDVKRDKKALNGIADDAQTHAGNKVAANIGTAYHAFTERLDAGLITLTDVPEQYRARCEQYINAIRAHGLTTRAEWIERTTAVRADQVSAPVPVAGTLDRIWQLPSGELVIGDLKTGSDLSYGWAEIAVQLAIYAHGVNTFGLFDWRSKTWEDVYTPTGVKVRTDYAIVMHLPADGDGCTLYRVNLVKGWEYAQVSGMVQTRQKDKSLAGVLVPGSLAAPVSHPSDSVRPQGLNPVISGGAAVVLQACQEAPETPMAKALRLVSECTDPGALGALYEYAQSSGAFTLDELSGIKSACGARWEALQA